MLSFVAVGRTDGVRGVTFLHLYKFKNVSFVAVGRTDGRSSWWLSVGFIQFALGSFYADCPHKRII